MSNFNKAGFELQQDAKTAAFGGGVEG